MPIYIINNLLKEIRKNEAKIENSKILILGIAYKKNIDDLRESPALKIIEILRKKRIKVSYSDPYIPIMPATRNYNFKMKSVRLSTNSIKKYDAVIIVTDHDLFNFKMIKKHSKLIIDCRGRFANLKKSKNIIQS